MTSLAQPYSKRVLRFELKPFETVSIPNGTILEVAEKDGVPNIWVEVLIGSSGEPLINTKAEVRAFATGELIESTWGYLQTVRTPPFVWHVYLRRA